RKAAVAAAIARAKARKAEQAAAPIEANDASSAPQAEAKADITETPSADDAKKPRLPLPLRAPKHAKHAKHNKNNKNNLRRKSSGLLYCQLTPCAQPQKHS
ncbi:hypothetical protein VIBRN418_01363, partial [Vibrio sp. N418]